MPSGGKESAALYQGERNICRKNHGADRYLGKFSLLGNIWHLSVPQ